MMCMDDNDVHLNMYLKFIFDFFFFEIPSLYLLILIIENPTREAVMKNSKKKRFKIEGDRGRIRLKNSTKARKSELERERGGDFLRERFFQIFTHNILIITLPACLL